MRTPNQTLERLAEVAPKEWGFRYGKLPGRAEIGLYAIGEDCLPSGSDIDNAIFTAFLKLKLREMGLFWTSCCHGDELYDCTVTKDRIVAKSGYVPTEWQAVAEARIGVLESA